MNELEDLSSVLRGLPPSPVIVMHSACSQPQRLAAWLATHAAQLHGARVVTLMPMAETPYAQPEALRCFEVVTFFPGKGLRGAVKSGAVSVTRVPLSRLCALFDSGSLKGDLLLLRLSPPDERGAHSLGVSVDYMPSVLAQSPTVVAEIDPSVPWTFGDTQVLPEQIDHAIAPAGPVTELPAAQPGAIDARVAEHVASLIPHGAILQIGIGAIPEAVAQRLGHLHGLGLHSGTITDAVLPLLHNGNITNATNVLRPGKSVVTMATGTQALYRFLHRNASIELRTCRDTHDPAQLATLPKLHAINSALQVDLTGAVDGERVDGVAIAGPGGLPDFAQGASASPGGASIVALRATSRDASASNILPRLAAQRPATVAGQHVDFLVTEFGIARLRGLSPQARARQIAAIAHPDFRPALLVAAG